jgi:hypothetical protein
MVDLERAIVELHRELEQLRDERAEPVCRCERVLECAGCRHEPSDCDCSNAADDERDALVAELGEDHYDDVDDPLLRTLLGLPSGIHCHTNGCPDA